MSWYRNHYRHTDCEVDSDIEWDDEWDCMCNSECPACGIKDIEPYDATTLQDDEPDEDDEVITYEVKTYAYCGMVIPHREFDDIDAAIEYVDARIERLAKLGSETHHLGPFRWEVSEPENCSMVPDYCGTLVIKEIIK